MDLEGISLSKKIQAEKDKHWMVSFVCGLLKNKTKQKQSQTHKK